MYLSDKDLSMDAKRYSQILNDIALEVQQLALMSTTLHKSNLNYSFLTLYSIHNAISLELSDQQTEQYVPRKAYGLPRRYIEHA